MGGFASMAQNDYGMKILGLVALAFGVLFGVQLISFFRNKENENLSEVLELVCLIVLAAILAMRVYYLHFPLVEVVFVIAGFFMVLIYARKLVRTYQENQTKSKLMAWFIVLFHASIILYVVSMTAVAFVPSLSEPAGGVAFALILILTAANLVKRDTIIEGEKISILQLILRFKDRSVILMALFILFTAYLGLTKVDVLPKMYSDEYPQLYFEMVNGAEKGNEELASGKYKHEEFKAKYDQFIERHAPR
jgi:uncharacterized protein with PQ loop repeat